MFYISILVDGKDKYYFQAELLIYSILNTQTATCEDLVVHCTESVESSFFDFLRKKSIRYKIITPYLDKTYCNKIRQLDFFLNLNKGKYRGVLLLDLDMFVVNKLIINDLNSFSGRIVGGPNPPLPVLKTIFEEASIPLPTLTPCSVQKDHDTFNNHFNGGFYYIPWGDLIVINRSWRFWAEWLFDRQHLFENEKQKIHIDQVSMCLALSSKQIKTKTLQNNYNFPTQTSQLVDFDKKNPIYLLHYHHAISNYGYFKYEHSPNSILVDSIKKANNIISKAKDFRFYGKFRSSLIRFQEDKYECISLTNSLIEIFGKQKKIDLLLHVGSPKTGTSSLQLYLDKNRDNLLSNGILYPHTSKDSKIPKHQWLIRELKSNNYNDILTSFQKINSQIDESINTVILSTEGIFTQWNELEYQGLSYLKSLNRIFNIKFLVWLREPASFTKSYYIQCLKNQRVKSRKCFGHDISVTDLLENEWYRGVLDYLNILNELKYHFSLAQVKVFKYEKNTIDQFSQFLKIPKFQFDTLRENTSLTSPSIAQLRIINTYNLSADEKKMVVKHLYEIDRIMKRHIVEDFEDEAIRERVKYLLKMIIPEIRKQYGIDLS